MTGSREDIGAVSVERDDVRVLYRRCADEGPAIQAAWASFEAAVGLRGRKFYGIFDPVAEEYRVCAETRPGDDAAALEAAEGLIPGGRYLRVRLRGEPPEVYSLIGPTFEQVEATADVDPGRPFVEYYRRRDEIDLLVPVRG